MILNDYFGTKFWNNWSQNVVHGVGLGYDITCFASEVSFTILYTQFGTDCTKEMVILAIFSRRSRLLGKPSSLIWDKENNIKSPTVQFHLSFSHFNAIVHAQPLWWSLYPILLWCGHWHWHSPIVMCSAVGLSVSVDNCIAFHCVRTKLSHHSPDQ